jgi:hypothetical protein
MNTVRGKTSLKETGMGIQDLPVAVFDVDPATSGAAVSQPLSATASAAFFQNLQGQRLGSTLTDASGRFHLDFQNVELQAAEQPDGRPDLLVVVSGPEQSSKPPCPSILHVSCFIRPDAGRSEEYLIRLEASQLEAAGIPLPPVAAAAAPGPPHAPLVVERIKQDHRRRRTIDAGIRALIAQRLTKQRELDQRVEAAFQNWTSPAGRDTGAMRPWSMLASRR